MKKRKYTKKQRHEIYKAAYKMMQGHYGFECGVLGLCYAIGYCAVEGIPVRNIESYHEMYLHFPEAYCFGRENGEDTFRLPEYFYNEGYKTRYETRRTILEFCIEMTKR